ncbi:histidine phosphatase family protein [Lacinutrix sp. Bg11-31]|uniref:SixA phosphatase family protein n=1 Tax=Lacinutrix sp. Bg11-31 TaxID=2057808 RepID=UPI000C306BCA|nr:histidine phosphatase family protein [Lacinutrix sp. Bg11-31]AUC81624.1 histidine phosphatase family protein [Lacinutrix sp. Bg11-31]
MVKTTRFIVNTQINTIKRSKTVFLIRHSKSCWDNELTDFERPIKKRGIVDANLVSNYLKNSEINPELILCSSAERAKLTAEIFIKNLALASVNIKYLKELYDFSGESLLRVIESCNNSFDSVMIFGHNFALTNCANNLGDTHIENVTTSGFVKINFEANSWKNLPKGKTEKIVFPKHLK